MFEKKAQLRVFEAQETHANYQNTNKQRDLSNKIFKLTTQTHHFFFLQKDDTSRIGSLLNHQMAPQNGTTHLAESFWRIAAAVRSGFHFQVWEDPSHLAAMVAWMVCWWIFVGEGAGENREIWDIQIRIRED